MAVTKSNPGLVATMWAHNTILLLHKQPFAEENDQDLPARSVSWACGFNKYYKGQFLGVLDMALVNTYIIHRHIRRRTPHFEFLAQLHKELVEETEDSFTQSRALPTDQRVPEQPVVAHSEHALTQTTDARLSNGVQCLRQRQCKVCSVYKPEGKKRGGTLTYYCVKCLEGKRGLIMLFKI
ncbi:hypothetical protein PHMEG_00036393 [Phytophthora megakarya]|uniref:PiggyBac transposable element-derived protein domain-containing protein n=1 Tax=Phytophthora megakarya TaxID=4795 RepID=A0A225UN87_9STRA|nr:hypothetical protein PHMEG_00036393 [Phytophthora megakarya]